MTIVGAAYGDRTDPSHRPRAIAKAFAGAPAEGVRSQNVPAAPTPSHHHHQGDDPMTATRSEATALNTLRAKLAAATEAEAALDRAILEARSAGASLRAIGNVLGHSHVAVHQRLRKLEAE